MNRHDRIEPRDIARMMGDSPEQYAEKLERNFPFPQVINIELTNKCNLKCIMCIRDLERPQGFMEEDLFRKIVDEASGYDPRLWLNFAGEPLLHEKFFAFADYCTRKNISSVNINTNATLIDGEMSRRLAAARLDTVAFSFDSMEKDVYEAIRVNAVFEQVRDNIIEFIRLRNSENPSLKIALFAVKQEDNISGLAKFRAFWEKHLKDGDRIVGIEFNTLGGQIKRPGIFSAPDASGKRLPCLQLWRNTVILWDGDVVICCGDFRGKNVMGNVRSQSLKEVWHGDKYKRLRLAHLNDDYSNYRFCGECDEWFYEGGEGRYDNLLK